MSSLVKAIRREQIKSAFPISDALSRGIYKAITVTRSDKTDEHFIDPLGEGRIAAYIPALGQDPDNPMYFKHASTGSIHSAPVDSGITVFVFFADGGKSTEGFWFAQAGHIVDVVSGGVSGSPKVDGSGAGEGAFSDSPMPKSYSTTDDIQKDEKEVANDPRSKKTATQGTLTDRFRGTSTSSPRRDVGYDIPQHSKVMGFKTPSGSAVSIDDGSIDDTGEIHPEQIRITTASGAAVILDGGNDFIYAVNSSGSGWVEIGANGEVMVYAEGSLSMRTEKDFNLRADKNINLEAGENIQMHSFGNTKINSDKELHLRSVGNQFLQSEAGMNINVGVNCVVSTGGKLHLNGPLAPESELILVDSMPDMQDLENTEVKDTIVSAMPTHEPFIRTQAKELKETASDFAVWAASDEGRRLAVLSEEQQAAVKAAFESK